MPGRRRFGQRDQWDTAFLIDTRPTHCWWCGTPLSESAPHHLLWPIEDQARDPSGLARLGLRCGPEPCTLRLGGEEIPEDPWPAWPACPP